MEFWWNDIPLPLCPPSIPQTSLRLNPDLCSDSGN